MYTLPEQLHRMAGEIQNLDLREFFVKIHNRKPVRTYTRDLEPPFKSEYCRRVMLPIFHKKAVAQSPYLVPVADVDALIAQRLAAAQPSSKPEANLATSEPSPLPIVDAPEKFAADFWQKRAKPLEDPPPRPKPKPTKPRGRKPVGDLPLEADRFRIIDGGNDGDGDKQK